jgi:hypothetical protein
VPALAPFCADSGIVVVDPPGVLLASLAPIALDTWAPVAPFVPGDTILVLDYLMEGGWNALWQDSFVVVELYREDELEQLVHPVTNYWWVHVRYEPEAVEGWILRSQHSAGSGGRSAGVREGGDWLDDRMFMRTTPAC